MNIKSRKSENIYRGLIKALERKDKALRNYANITSHELRAPIASILGLMQLWDLHQHDDEFCHSLMVKMQQCAVDLDMVTRKLNEELDPSINVLNPETGSYRY